MAMVIKFIIFFVGICMPFQLRCQEVTFSNSNSPIYALQIERNYSEHCASIYLKKNSILIDSMQLKDLDFAIDSLVNINNAWWYYVFSECTSCVNATSWEEKNQYILTIKNDKIHLALVLSYRWSHGRDLTTPYIPNQHSTNSKLASIKKNYSAFRQIILDRYFFKGNRVAEEIFYSSRSLNPVEDRGIIRKYKIKYDKDKRVFYNKKKIINSECLFATDGEDVKKKLENEEILLLDFYGDCMAFYQNKWYSYVDNYFIPMELFKTTCPGNCK